jgi:hypothetical protein
MPKYRMKKEINGYIPGSHRICQPGKNDIIVNAGEEVECDAELLKNVMHKFDIVDPFEAEKPKGTTLIIVKRPKTEGFYDVLNVETGKAINTKALRKAQAEDLAGRKYIEPLDIEGDTEENTEEPPA